MTKVIHLFDHYRPRKNDEPAMAIRRLLLRRKFTTGERVCDGTNSGTVIEVSLDGSYVRVMWDRRRDHWHDELDIYRI
jgi:hypothetical protein